MTKADPRSRATPRSRALLRATCPLLLGGLVIALLPAPAASAAGRTVRDDRRDAPARVDLVKAKFVNGSKRVKVRAKFRDLKNKGTFSLMIGPNTHGDLIYSATVRRKRGGTKAKLSFLSGPYKDPVTCKVAARWNARRDVVRVSFPHRCMYFEHRSNYMGADMRHGSRAYDRVSAGFVRRG